MKRRDFIKHSLSAAAAFSAPAIIPSKVFGQKGSILPSNKITIACIGVGWQGTGNMENILRENDAKVVAVCDVDKNHLENGRNIVNKVYGNNDCQTYTDYREVLARKDIDAVMLGLPDHWHSIPAIEAANAGKDVFGEKPLSHTLAEGRAMVDAIKRNNRIWQTGSWQRSEANFQQGAELVRNGRIGDVKLVKVGLPSGHADFAGTKGQDAIVAPPAELDYETWLGPAPWKPYVKSRHHKNWRWDLDYGGGQIMDWVGHHIDIAHWGLGFDETGPIKVKGQGDYPATGVWETATKYKCEATYADGTVIEYAGGYDSEGFRGGTTWIGDEGWIYVTRGGVLQVSDPKILRDPIAPHETHLFKSPGHFRNWLDSIKTRQQTLTPCETAHRSASPGHLGQIAMLLGRTINFNPETEEILGDETASRMLTKSFRHPWHL